MFIHIKFPNFNSLSSPLFHHHHHHVKQINQQCFCFEWGKKLNWTLLPRVNLYCPTADESNTLFFLIIIITTIIIIVIIIIIIIITDELADMAIHSESDSVRDELSSGIRLVDDKDDVDGHGDGDGGDGGSEADDDHPCHDCNEVVHQERGRGGWFPRDSRQRSKTEPGSDWTRSRSDWRAADEKAKLGFDAGPALVVDHLLPLVNLNHLCSQAGPVFTQVGVYCYILVKSVNRALEYAQMAVLLRSFSWGSILQENLFSENQFQTHFNLLKPVPNPGLTQQQGRSEALPSPLLEGEIKIRAASSS